MSSKSVSNPASNNSLASVSRRSLLKGMAASTTLAVSGVSGAALAASKSLAPSKVSIVNASDQVVYLNGALPVSLEKVNGWVVVAINKSDDHSLTSVESNSVVALLPGEASAFDVDPMLAASLSQGDEVVTITNEYSAQSNMVPIFTYDEAYA